ncbi:MAG: hypothetical protein JSU91_02040 [Thermoplasmatales archaeon]|nr:MAG: hypothetical protein JSU91_02040 [Thermoplasmatales archaeon]
MKKLVGIVVLTLLFSTSIHALGELTNKNINTINNFCINKNDRQNTLIGRPLINYDRGALFIQLPCTPDEEFNGLFSDLDGGFREYDDFWNLTSPICDIHWWGFGVIWNGTHWITCDASDMIFDITFYHDDGTGKPGDEACSYKDMEPSITPTGISYEIFGSTGILELYYFEIDIDPCCQLSDGWVSVFKTYNPSDCVFAWLTCPDANWNMWRQNVTSGEWIWINWDLSFILTDGEPFEPDLECDGEIRGRNMPPGIKVFRNFTIRNKGDTDSVLHWNIESYPNDWGDNWSITPDRGILTSGMDWITIDVEFNVPLEENTEFTGNITVVNAEDPSDYCEINVKINTPRSRKISSTLLEIFFERFPNAFPILRQLFGL